nr:MAG: capsid protein [Cressdnaviricota sp.]
MARTRGYHYARRADGTKYRVYSRGNYTKQMKGMRPARRGQKKRFASAKRPRTNKGALRMGGATQIHNKGGYVTISHEEYLGDIVSSASFANEAFALNPGISLSQGGFCNWLPVIATQFEQWRPIAIQFQYKSTSSDAVLSTAANSALGTISMATDYNVLNAPFANKVQMENYEFSQSCKPSVNMIHHVECSRKQTPVSEMYIRTGPVPANADQRLYDLGLFQIAASGQQVANGDLGELWVRYTIQFLKPRILSGVGGVNEGAVNFDHIQIYNSAKLTANVLPATPFGNSATVPLYPTSESTLGGVISGGAVAAADFTYQANTPTLGNFNGGIPVLVNGIPNGNLGAGAPNTYYFPPGVSTGNYLITYVALYGTAGSSSTTAITPSNCSALLLLNNDTVGAQGNTSTANTTTMMSVAFVSITKANASFSFVGTAGMTAPTYADIFVTQIPSPIN